MEEEKKETEEKEASEITFDRHRKPKTFKEKFEDLKGRIKVFFSNPKKRLIFIISSGLVIILLFGYGIYRMTHENGTTTTAEKNKKTETVDNSPKYDAILDGTKATQDAANRHPLAVIVENHPAARPQAGLDQASIVYEALAEGGITRFMAVFGTNTPEKVGPVRSARTYFVDWSRGYDAYIAHVGGNIDALDQIKAEKVPDLDEFLYPSSYWREEKPGLATEHTMFASVSKLYDQANKNGYSKSNNFTAYRFKDDPKDAEKTALPEKQTININFSSAEYAVKFEYDKATNSYKRFLAGAPHTDQVSKQQLDPKNVVVMTVNRKATTTRINEAGYEMTTVGSGNAKIFLDGKVISGTWKKESKTDRELFYDESGKEITFNRGQTWVSVIPPDGSVTVQ